MLGEFPGSPVVRKDSVLSLLWPGFNPWSGNPVSCATQQRKKKTEGFPGGAVVKNPPASAGDTGSSPGPGRSHMP